MTFLSLAVASRSAEGQAGPGTITGRVTSPERQTIIGATVTAVLNNRSAVTDTGGAYALRNVAAGSDTLRLINLPSGCDDPAEQIVKVTTGGMVTVNFDVRCTGMPTIPAVGYPDDSIVIQNPHDTIPIYHRRFLAVAFRPNATGPAIQFVLGKYRAQVHSGTINPPGYIIQYPDPGPSYAAYESRVDSIHAEPAVLAVLRLTLREYPPRMIR